MSAYEICAHLGGLLTIVSFAVYIHSILLGVAKPVIASWAIWGGLNVIVAGGMLTANAVNPQALVAAAGTLVVFVLSLHLGRSGWSTIDIFCLIFGVLGICFWLLTGSPTMAIVTCLAAIFIANIPTIASAWEDPSRESTLAWAVAVASSAFTIFGIEVWRIESLAQPVVYLLGQSIIFACTVRPHFARA